jgi:Holliday junction resolvase RusA-like endonuclease
MSDLCFTVYGRPQQKGSKRALPRHGVKGGRPILVDSNKRSGPWAGEVREAAGKARAAQQWGVLAGAVAVQLDFFFGRPKGHYGSGRNADAVRAGAPRRMATMPDIDKLARTVLDALSGVVYRDDGQVCVLQLAKHYGDPERLEAKVVAL